MPSITLQFSISDTTIALIDALRDVKTTREELLCLALEVGISRLLMEASVEHVETISRNVAASKFQTDGRRILFSVDCKISPSIAGKL